ncbi:hypothetical protein SAMN02745154_00386 [Mycoplasmopsis verecunda]|uniref:Uncharacterized protein n=1 Tax=Mycoplasmopsis verecunda TaxID=171291 RepID=A0A1T4L9U7_9BACT|nr:hypothetical protein SAMN02745154_00386 [Mycoplasmopsis verecunda]
MFSFLIYFYSLEKVVNTYLGLSNFPKFPSYNGIKNEHFYRIDLFVFSCSKLLVQIY